MLKLQSLFFLIALLFPLASNAKRIDTSITVGTLKRKYVAHIPDNINPNTKIPLLFVFHPALATGEFMEETAKFHTTGNGKNYIVVYPDGHKRKWNAGICCGDAYKENIDDVGFVEAIIETMKKEYNIEDKIFITGFSSGSMFVYNLICRHPEKIAAASPFGATRSLKPEDNNPACKSNHPVPLLHLHGNKDKQSPVEGGYAGAKKFRERLGYMHPAEENASIIASNNNCSPQTFMDNQWQQELDTSCKTWSQSCTNNSIVKLCIIPNLGHTWPGGAQGTGFMARRFGPARPDLNASKAIISFFDNY